MVKGKIIKNIKNVKSSILQDEYGDSKFGLDMCNYFPREMIQNALDVRMDKEMPLFVSFEFKEIEIQRIPGLDELKKIIINCKNTKGLQTDTVEQYNKVLKQIDSGKIMCLKISDKNTYGVVKKDGNSIDGDVDNEAWCALLYDVGHSVKAESGSGGRHGVGKKVAFILSSFRTVFYCTHTVTGTTMFMGKSTLTDFVEGDTKYWNQVWFGKTGNSEEDVLPLESEELYGIDPFFIRTDETGTDIVIVGVDGLGEETSLEEVKKKIILGILDNFFVAIQNKELTVKVQDVEISNVNNEFTDFLKSFKVVYENEYNKMNSDEYTNSVQGQKSNLLYGNLYNYYNAYINGEKKEISVEFNGEIIGKAIIKVSLENSYNKKYVSIFRKHGMKIMDLGPVKKAGVPFSAVVSIEGEVLNDYLAKAENAAHDDFDIWNDEHKKKMYNQMISDIKDVIKEMTKVDVGNQIPIDEFLGETYCFVGDKNIARLKDTENEQPKARKIEVKRKKHNSKDKNEKKKEEEKQEEKKREKKNKKRNNNTGKIINGRKYQLISEYEQEPVLFYSKKEQAYRLQFKLVETVDNIVIDLSAINSDGNDESIIKEFISKAEEGKTRYKVNRENGTIRRDGIANNKLTFDVCIVLKKKLNYQIKPLLYTQVKEELNET